MSNPLNPYVNARPATQYSDGQTGITLADQVAMQVLTALVGNPDLGILGRESLVERSWDYAELFLKEREKRGLTSGGVKASTGPR